mmetsp:Transcript_134153/g.388349  ORF Transcript_134153/g.388349 Transcript_134153/m.388349 type:complete len:232 (+) Transcript_134153:1205-1900(+)
MSRDALVTAWHEISSFSMRSMNLLKMAWDSKTKRACGDHQDCENTLLRTSLEVMPRTAWMSVWSRMWFRETASKVDKISPSISPSISFRTSMSPQSKTICRRPASSANPTPAICSSVASAWRFNSMLYPLVPWTTSAQAPTSDNTPRRNECSSEQRATASLALTSALCKSRSAPAGCFEGASRTMRSRSSTASGRLAPSSGVVSTLLSMRRAAAAAPLATTMTKRLRGRTR